MPEIESCYFMAGVESYLLTVRVGTIAELEQLIVRINRTPGVASHPDRDRAVHQVGEPPAAAGANARDRRRVTRRAAGRP